jgi:hypothetical protein
LSALEIFLEENINNWFCGSVKVKASQTGISAVNSVISVSSNGKEIRPNKIHHRDFAGGLTCHTSKGLEIQQEKNHDDEYTNSAVPDSILS